MPQGEYLQFGGMAVVEGVMMRSPNHYSVACRAPNGEIVVFTEHIEKTWIGRQNWLKTPFLRGSLAMLDTMALGIKAMKVASNVQLDETKQAADAPIEAPANKTVQSIQIAATIVAALALGSLIFDFAPEAAAQAAQAQMGLSGTAANAIAESIKAVLFIGYLALIRRWGPILDVFRYHGAEHKAINALEHGKGLTTEACQAESRLHPRCGTNFAIVVLIISFLVFVPLPRTLFVPEGAANWLIVLIRMGLKIAIMPIVAGISYEVIRMAGKFRDQRWVELLLKPGLATQLITTAEPNDGQVEVAIASLEAVMKAEETGELTNTETPSAEGETAGAMV